MPSTSPLCDFCKRREIPADVQSLLCDVCFEGLGDVIRRLLLITADMNLAAAKQLLQDKVKPARVKGGRVVEANLA